MVTITKRNFLEESNDLIQKLPSAAYVSLNIEMTGVATPDSKRPNKNETPTDRYRKTMKDAPERYNIIQVGIAVFHENPLFKTFVKDQVGHLGDEEDDHNDEEDADEGESEGEDQIRRRSLDSNCAVAQSDDELTLCVDRTIRQAQEDIAATAAAVGGGNHQENDTNNEQNNASNENVNGANANMNDNNEQDQDNDNDSNDTEQQNDDIGVGGIIEIQNMVNNDNHAEHREANNDDSSINASTGTTNNNDGHNDILNNNDDGNSSDDDSDDNDDDSDDNNIQLEDDDDSHSSGPGNNNDELNEDQEPPEFLVYKYNFFLFPAPQTNRNMPTREVVMNPVSIAFLNEQDLDFKEWITNGIPYTTLNQSTVYLHQFYAKYKKLEREEKEKEKWSKTGQYAANPPPLEDQEEPYEPTQPQEVAFIARSMANLREWIDSAAPPMRNINGNLTLEEEERLGIIKLVQHHKKEHLTNCLVRKIKNEYPSLHWYKHSSVHYVLRLSEEEKKIRDERIKRVEWWKMHNERIGFTRVFKALSDACRGELGNTKSVDEEYNQFLGRCARNKPALTNNRKNRRRVPIVVHNGLLDLLFLMTHFHSGKLPINYNDTKRLISHYFPKVYDTKIIATECIDYRFRSKNSSLSELYQRHVMGIQNINDQEHHEVMMRFVYPRVEIINDITTRTQRDAGDDAFMVGAVFQCLCRPIVNQGLLEESDAMNERSALYLEIVKKKIKDVGSLIFLDAKYPFTRILDPSLFGLNQIFLPHSIYTINLDDWHGDPMRTDNLKGGYSFSSIFRVSQIVGTVSFEEIHSVLSQVRDDEHSKIPFEILSIKIESEISSFVVAARIKSPRSINSSIFSTATVDCLKDTLEKNGFYIRRALEEYYPNHDVVSLSEAMSTDYNDALNGNNAGVSTFSHFVTGILDTVGLKRWYHSGETGNDDNVHASRKRRRAS